MRTLHRDIGYFFIGVTLLYAITGFILSARALGWFKTEYKFSTVIEQNISKDELKIKLILEAKAGKLNKIYKKETYLSVEKNIRRLEFVEEQNNVLHFYRKNNFDVLYDKTSGLTQIKYIDYPPYLKIFIDAHKSNHEKVWFYLSMVYSFVLAFFAISSIFIVKGKYGFKRRGIYFTSLGVLTILVFIFFSFYY